MISEPRRDCQISDSLFFSQGNLRSQSKAEPPRIKGTGLRGTVSHTVHSTLAQVHAGQPAGIDKWFANMQSLLAGNKK